ncbi:hypothetical protein [Bradyrhizobium arachidis]|uniref:Uncharacterized protein n=1 Tax=Bradyrhizobium arachidis TaxID=858423 RepID=A0AAE7NP42_9BRAD|nr:hypothetical protein [Bradyrhizobium arachidis]QOZ69012.1 hypothetical protein WN72_23815 [Bradyrhizobium arachidis]
MIRNFLAAVQFGPLAITLFVAIAGAVVALIGGFAGWDGVTDFGKLAAGGGALGFFGWLFLPIILRSI